MSTVEQVQEPASSGSEGDAPVVSVVIPCLNEAHTIETCARAARAILDEHGLAGEVIVADNGSTDGSAELAERTGALVVREPRRGYGSAYRAGLAAARGKFVVMLDADLTYDVADIPRFVTELERGADLVMGDRMDNIKPGAMPWLHRHVGNPALTGLLNLLFHTGVHDAHCGMRAIRRNRLTQLGLRTIGMEFASEMVIRASQEKLDIRQLPIEYHPRRGESKLKAFRDGWRHLRFLLVHSPTHLFLIPGGGLIALGALIQAIVFARLEVFGRVWDLHTLITGSLLMIVGTQVMALGICAHAYGTYFLNDRDPRFDRLRARFSLEHGLLLGAVFTLAGLAAGTFIFLEWLEEGFGRLAEERLAIAAITSTTIGVQIFFSSFLVSILGLRKRP